MTRRPALLAALSAAALLSGCSGPLVTAEIETVRITSTGVTLSGNGLPGYSALGTITADLGPVGESFGSGFVTELNLKSTRISWEDPAARPDFSGVTSATLTAIPDAASGLPNLTVATYVQDPADPNPVELVIVGDPSINLFDYLSGGELSLSIDAQGTLPGVAWSALATVVAEMSFKVEYSL